MKALTQLFRLIRINFILMRYGLDQIILATRWFAPIRFIGFFNPFNWFRHHKDNRGKRIRQSLEALGPTFVKFGQILSTRRDLLPEDIADELALLQDRVPPFPNDKAKAIVEQAYDKPVDEVFASFNPAPMASASIAQVHKATLKDGTEVVVKVCRPNIKKIIKRDVALMYTFAKLLERYWSQGPRLHPVEIVAEFERTIFDELDLLREAANASQLRRNFTCSDILYVPEIYWDYCHINVMVIERIHGVPATNVEQLKVQGVNLKLVAERGVEIFFTQVFRDCFFHADMHPGNIFIAEGRPNDPQYIAVDFGIMGSLSPNDQRYLAENLLAFFKRDYQRVAELHIESGWVPKDTRIDEFEAAIRAVCEPIFERPMKDISFGHVLLRLFQTARRFNMEVQPQLVLLQKTLLNIEGMGRQLYPELDLWQTAKPFLEAWLKNQVGPKALLKNLRDNLPYWMEKLPEMPNLIYDILHHSRQQQLPTMPHSLQPEQKKTSTSRGVFMGIGLTLLATASYLLAHSTQNVMSIECPEVILGIGAVGVVSLLVGMIKR